MPEELTNPFPMGTQNHALLERLRSGPVKNYEIVRDLRILKYTGRLSDVRKGLRRQGLDLVERKIHDFVHEYRIVNPKNEKEEREDGR